MTEMFTFLQHTKFWNSALNVTKVLFEEIKNYKISSMAETTSIDQFRVQFCLINTIGFDFREHWSKNKLFLEFLNFWET